MGKFLSTKSAVLTIDYVRSKLKCLILILLFFHREEDCRYSSYISLLSVVYLYLVDVHRSTRYVLINCYRTKKKSSIHLSSEMHSCPTVGPTLLRITDRNEKSIYQSQRKESKTQEHFTSRSDQLIFLEDNHNYL